MSKRIGVFICHCGGNISDYVDVEAVREYVSQEEDVVLARTHMFVCSDAAQEEIAKAIQEDDLKALVIASCSPKLHQETFRRLAQRAGLNPYTYVQVNIREQCSWAHSHRTKATQKALRLVRAGIARARLAEPLDPIKVRTVPEVLVIGAGVTGMRTALALADLGLKVHLMEKEEDIGGLLSSLYTLAPYGVSAKELVQILVRKIEASPNIELYLGAKLLEKHGSVGQFQVTVSSLQGERKLEIGAIVVATGAKAYQPSNGEYAYGLPGVITLSELHQLLRQEKDELRLDNKKIQRVAFIYCVGSRDKQGHSHCSRYCCTAAIHAGLELKRRFPSIKQYHLYRDMRTYGDQEVLYHQALEEGLLFFRFTPPAIPEVQREQEDFLVRVKDQLTGGEEVEIQCDLVVLVTGLEPSVSEDVQQVLKLPVGQDGFFNEVHPKLRPVETVIDGIFIAGTCQGPKNVAESVASGMAASTKAGVLLLPGVLNLEPLVARVDPTRCSWCGLCEEVCPYEAITKVEQQDHHVARVNPALCKGEGACVWVCPEEAIEVQGYGHQTIKAQIKALCKGEA